MRGKELARVGEDADAPSRPPDGLAAYDLDVVCAYSTFKVVRIKDRVLGALYWGTVTTIVLYITIVAFHVDQRHQESDPGVGTVMTRFRGKAHAAGDPSKVFDEADLRFPVIEPAGAFIMTRRIVMKGQKPGKCVDWDNPRPCPCDEGAVCTAGYCEVQGWCPSLGDGNVEPPPETAEVLDIVGLENTILNINAGIAFPYAGNYFYLAGGSDSVEDVYTNITLGALLSHANPPLKIQDLTKKGALIGVSFFWNCELTSLRTFMGDLQDIPTGLGEERQLCPYHVAVARLDGGQGFAQKRAQHQKTGGTETRDAMYIVGLKIVVDSSGVGRRVSLVLMVIQFGSMFCLLKLAAQIADFVMLYLYASDRRDAYKRCKVIETKDYSDLQERIDQVQEQRQAFMTRRTASPSASGGAGTQIALGLGGGGRGGSGPAILRGRGGPGP